MTVSAASAPQWMYSSWSRSCRALGATASDDEISAVARTLLTRWDEPQRKYHTISHLVEVLRRVDELAWEAHNADEVRLAAWYHGAIFTCDSAAAYANKAGEDKAASAELARTDLTSLGLDVASVERVASLVNSMRRHAGQAGDTDLNVLIDADLAILAETPQVYQAYRDAIRAEYAHIPEDDYLAARVKILEKLQQRSRIFHSAGAQAWESQARENLNAEMARLQRKLHAGN